MSDELELRRCPHAVMKQAMDLMEGSGENQFAFHKVFNSLPFVKQLGQSKFGCFLKPRERSDQ